MTTSSSAAAGALEGEELRIVQLRVNGAETGPPIDMYHDRVVVSEELPPGEFDLRAGANYLTMQIVAAHEKAVKSYMAGLDYTRLEPAE